MCLLLVQGIDAVAMQVSPHSAIYFYEFSCPSAPGKLWTTRFTITGSDGESTPPTEPTQPNGDTIAWGNGKLVATGDNSSLPLSSPSDPSSLPPSSSSSLPGGSSILSSSSRLSSTRTPAPTQTSINTSSSQSGSNGGMAVAISKALVFVIGLVTASTAFFI